MPDQFWSLTLAEFYNKHISYHIEKAKEASNFRAVYHILHNVNVKKGNQRTAKALWPLLIDYQNKGDGLTHDQRVDRYEKLTGKKINNATT